METFKVGPIGRTITSLTLLGSFAGFLLIGDPAYSLPSFLALLILGFGSAVILSRGELTEGQVMFLVFVASILAVFIPPHLSNDLYRYLWEGDLLFRGGDPYRSSPGAFTDGDPIRQLINHPELPSIYPPLFLLIAGLVMHLSYSVMAWKMFLAGCHALTSWLIVCALKKRGLSHALSALYSLHPLVLLEAISNGHLDSFLSLFLVVSYFFYLRGEIGFAAFFLGGAISFKWMPLVVLPIFVTAVPREKRVRFLAVSLLLPLLSVALWPGDTRSIFFTLTHYLQSWEFNSPLVTIGRFLALDPFYFKKYLPLAGVVMGLAISLRLREVPTRVQYMLGLFLVFGAVCYPWYFLPVLVFLPFTRSSAWGWLSIALPFSYMVLPAYRSMGLWIESPGVISLQFLPFFGLLGWEIWGRSGRAKKGSLGGLPKNHG